MNFFVTALVLIILFNAVGFLIGRRYDISSLSWYKEASKQIGTIPPGAVFGIVWTLLYTLMGISLAMILNTDCKWKTLGLVFFAIQLFFNYIWTPTFVSGNIVNSSFIILITMMFTILTILVFYRINMTAALLLVPYVAWLLQAWYFNNRLVEVVGSANN